VIERCVFCGGARAAQGRVFMPPGVLFGGTELDGYDFPACTPCGLVTRDAEDVVAVLARLRQVTASATELAQIHHRSRVLKQFYPALHAEMEPTIRERREAVARFKLHPPPGGTVLDIPLFQVNGPLVNAAVSNFARKLFCALHRLHSGEALGPGGGIEVRWFPNLLVGELPPNVASLFLQFPRVTRTESVLGEEFFYRWGMSLDKPLAGYLTFFHNTFAMLGMVHGDAEPVIAQETSRVLRPFDWSKDTPPPAEVATISDGFRAALEAPRTH
jgi:hypothetical protein